MVPKDNKQDEETDFVKVKAKKARKGPREENQKSQSPNSQVRMELCQADWDVPPRAHLIYGEEGVLMVTNPDEQKHLVQRLHAYPHRFALLSMGPIAGAPEYANHIQS